MGTRMLINVVHEGANRIAQYVNSFEREPAGQYRIIAEFLEENPKAILELLPRCSFSLEEVEDPYMGAEVFEYIANYDGDVVPLCDYSGYEENSQCELVLVINYDTWKLQSYAGGMNLLFSEYDLDKLPTEREYMMTYWAYRKAHLHELREEWIRKYKQFYRELAIETNHEDPEAYVAEHCEMAESISLEDFLDDYGMDEYDDEEDDDNEEFEEDDDGTYECCECGASLTPSADEIKRGQFVCTCCGTMLTIENDFSGYDCICIHCNERFPLSNAEVERRIVNCPHCGGGLQLQPERLGEESE